MIDLNKDFLIRTDNGHSRVGPGISSMEKFLKLPSENKIYLYYHTYSVEKNKFFYTYECNKDKFIISHNKITLHCRQGRFFKKNKVEAYIKYDKNTGKVTTKNSNDLKSTVIELFFYEEMDLFFPKNMSPTFMKKVLEGKIKTIEDVLNYSKSYVYRNKKIPLDILYKLEVMNCRDRIPYIDNFELFDDIDNIKKLKEVEHQYFSSIISKITCEEDLDVSINTLKFSNWVNKMKVIYE